MNFKLLTVACIISCLSFVLPPDKKTYKDDKLKCVYEFENGMFNGVYTSYHKNGKVKASGTFKNNGRTGIWQIFNNKGNLLIKRIYENPFVFKQVFPDTFIQNKYPIMYNGLGYINYFPLDASMIIWQKDVWRLISKQNNPLLFENNRLFNLLYYNVLKENVMVFKDENDNFGAPYNSDNFPYVQAGRAEIIGYKIKEGAFFDKERKLTETRVVGICPVIINVDRNDTSNLFWVYLPAVRKYLADEKLKLNDFKLVKNVDDLFFYRYYASSIYKEDKKQYINQYTKKPGIKKEEERIELNIIEAEHDLWLN